MCTNSRAINRITIRYRFPIPRIEDLMDCLGEAQFFTNIDLKSGYHQIRIKECDEWKIAFKTTESIYEWLVMPFGLSNSLGIFMRLMNEVMKDFISKFVMVYLDDILIFSKDRVAHLSHLDSVLKRLYDEKITMNLEKCEFVKKELVYLGFVLSQGNLKMDPRKVEAIVNWPTPKSATDVRSFHGLAQYYRKFIRHFSAICAPMLDTIRGGMKAKFQWNEAENKGFETLREKIATQPVPVLPSFEKLFIVECDASNIVVGVVLSQEERPVAFHSEKLSDAKRR